MVYDPQIPKKEDVPQDSQAEILENFTQMNTVFAVNHVAFNDAGADKGKHKFVSFPQQAQATIDDIDVATNERFLYAKADGADTELFIKTSSSPDTEFQVTRDNLLYLGLHPAAAVNFTPDNAGPFPATITPDSSYNIADPAAVTPGVVQTATGQWTITFENQITDAAGAATRQYMWSMFGMRADAGAMIVQPLQGVYDTNVTADDIKIIAVNQNGSAVNNGVRISVMIWKVQ